ncbi:MAG: PAS domain S-box protein [Balneolaceae bacterium]|nr:PAS domain S-box protein [Balneolaceae bacterium]
MNAEADESSLKERFEELIYGSESFFGELIKNSFDMIVLLDSDGLQHYVSESCEKILGYKPDELIGIDVIEEMIHPEDKQKTFEGLKGIIEKTKFGGTQYRHKHKNGSWVYLETFGTNQLDNPLIKAVVLNVRDVTARKQSEEALLESEARLNQLIATKDKFFSIIGHDLRNPFAGIIGLSELLIKEVESENYDDVADYAHLIHDSSIKAMDLLTNLLLWSRTQTGRYDYQPDHFNITEIIKEEIELLRDSANLKSVAIDCVTKENISLFADKSMIKLVIRNLISNAVKFSYSGSSVIITVEPSEDKIMVNITDSGMGIDPKQLEVLFQLDKRYSTAGTNNEMGSGLGLLLCKEFIDLHNGEIWAESEPGKGSTFSFSIPIFDTFA